MDERSFIPLPLCPGASMARPAVCSDDVVEDEAEMEECEKCGQEFGVEECELDENGYCSECVAGNEDARSLDRYFHSISR